MLPFGVWPQVALVITLSGQLLQVGGIFCNNVWLSCQFSLESFFLGSLFVIFQCSMRSSISCLLKTLVSIFHLVFDKTHCTSVQSKWRHRSFFPFI